MTSDTDTIAAIATAPGKGGVGIIRISGPLSASILQTLCQQDKDRCLKPRYANYANFYTADQDLIDQGISLFFQSPNSFTGEDVVEVQGHGGPVILDCLLARIIELGARQARPGEFSERAFLNDKIDLAQAEAIADLIDSSSQQAAFSAVKTLQGEFSSVVHDLVEALIQLRIYVEAAIDFPEEEIDFLADSRIHNGAKDILSELHSVLRKASTGAALSEGLQVAIAGLPNAGKSSLLNALAEKDAAIVTDIAGTTRDILKETILVDGIPIHITDTAGIRESDDTVEAIGIERAHKAIAEADLVLLIEDSTADEDKVKQQKVLAEKVEHAEVVVVRNKADLSGEQDSDDEHRVVLSAKQGLGIDRLKSILRKHAGFQQNEASVFSARRRHITALNKAIESVEHGISQLHQNAAGELLAEDLRQAQQYLNEITGEFTPDDLLGRIFSSFCIGK